MTVKERRVLVGPGEGSRLPILDIVHKVTAGDSCGSLVIDEWVLHPGQTIPPHTHANEDECSFILDGELTCYVGGRVVGAPKGSYVVKPRGVPHAGAGKVAESRDHFDALGLLGQLGARLRPEDPR